MKRSLATAVFGVLVVVAASAPAAGAASTTRHSNVPSAKTTNASGRYEPVCASRSSLCADPYNTVNGKYVGHDEPSLEYKSGLPGSGNDMTYTLTLPKDPKQQPTASGGAGSTRHTRLCACATYFN